MIASAGLPPPMRRALSGSPGLPAIQRKRLTGLGYSCCGVSGGVFGICRDLAGGFDEGLGV